MSMVNRRIRPHLATWRHVMSKERNAGRKKKGGQDENARQRVGRVRLHGLRAGGASGLLLGVEPREQEVGHQSPDAPGQHRMRITDGLQALVNSTICRVKLPFDTQTAAWETLSRPRSLST